LYLSIFPNAEEILTFCSPYADGNLLEPELVTRPLKRTNPDYCFNASQPAVDAFKLPVSQQQQTNQNIDFPSFSQPASSFEVNILFD
jgi:hypothetical protein